ncbi:MAG: lipopolysaccharide biosynthesis protein [Promethearchaeota archaeon]
MANKDKNIEKKLETDNLEEDLWKEIGFVRPLGGLLYNLVLVIGASGFGLIFSVWLIPSVIYPYPSAIGWEQMTKSLFEVYFVAADIGIGIAIERFIGEINIKSPKDSIKYMQFFIYFQMFSGVIQITAIAFWVFSILPESDLTYASWFFLIFSTIQWPGMLGIFTGALQAYQRFDRANIVKFMQAIVLENTTRIICILIGRYFGGLNPQVGELMGATMGSLIGAYIDDFLAALIGAHWLAPILKDIDKDWTIWRLFYVEFDLKIVKETLLFGVKVMLPKVIFPLANMISVFILTKYLPSYSSIWGIYVLADMIGGLSGTFIFEFTSTFSEAYNNKKFRLARDYIARIYRWTGLLGGFIIGVMFPIAPLLVTIMGSQYQSAVPMMRAIMFFKVMEAIIKYHDRIFQGGGKPEYNIVSLGIEQAMRILLLYIFLVFIPSGGMAIVLSRGLGWIIKWFVSAFLIQKKIIKLKINLWQTIVAPFISTFIEIITLTLLISLLLPIFENLIGNFLGTIIIIILCLLLGVLIIWFPLYGYFGGWDSYSLEIFKKARKISGPSKFFVGFIAKMTNLGIRKSPFHNKFVTNTEGIKQEIEELVETRKANLKFA